MGMTTDHVGQIFFAYDNIFTFRSPQVDLLKKCVVNVFFKQF